MKPYYFLFDFLLIAVFLIGCGKAEQKANSKQSSSASIIGDWELRELQGGMMANPGGPNYPPGNGDRWKFTDSVFERYINGQLVLSGKYSLTRDTSPATGRYMDAFILQEDSPHMIFFEFSSDTLVLYDGMIAADGTISKFVKPLDK